MIKSQLSERSRWLVEICQRINFGSVTFYIRNGEADPDQGYASTRTLKLAGVDDARPELAAGNYTLRREQVALIARLDGLPDGAQVRITIAHGLPGPIIELLEERMAA